MFLPTPQQILEWKKVISTHPRFGRLCFRSGKSSHSLKHLFSYLRFANADSDDAEKVVKEIKACMGEGRAIFKAAKHAKFEKAAERKKNLAQFK